jgi:hypothetical protein
MSSDNQYISYQVVAASSQSQDSRIDELMQQSLQLFEPLRPAVHGGWENSRNANFPQEVIFRLETRALLNNILIVSKENRSIPECEVYAGDGFTGSFADCDYRHAGTIKEV